MKLYSYCIPMDDGAAPNPYWGVCTLTICKPQIRRVARKDDWVIGVGSKRVNGNDYSGRLVYAMKVTDVMSLEDYDVYCQELLPGKIPDVNSRSYKRKVGDCIYDFSRGRVSQRKGVHRPQHQAKDLRGLNALLSKHFYYFGDRAVKIPSKSSLYLFVRARDSNRQRTRTSRMNLLRGLRNDLSGISFMGNRKLN